MAEQDCNTTFRIFPQIYAFEIAKFFEIELHLGKTTQWGVGKYRVNVEHGCKHWMMMVLIGEKTVVPAMCFKTRKEAEEYCNLVGSQFPMACQSLWGADAVKFSSN